MTSHSYALLISSASAHSAPLHNADLAALCAPGSTTTASSTASSTAIIPIPEDFSYTIEQPLLLGDLAVDDEFTTWIINQISALYPERFISEITKRPESHASTLFSGDITNTRVFGTFWVQRPLINIQKKHCYQIVEVSRDARGHAVYTALASTTYIYAPPPARTTPETPVIALPLSPHPVYHYFPVPKDADSNINKHQH